MKELDEKGSEHTRTFTVAILKDLLQYHFKLDVYKQSGIKKLQLIEETIALYKIKNRVPLLRTLCRKM